MIIRILEEKASIFVALNREGFIALKDFHSIHTNHFFSLLAQTKQVEQRVSEVL